LQLRYLPLVVVNFLDQRLNHLRQTITCFGMRVGWIGIRQVRQITYGGVEIGRVNWHCVHS
jgi:hypothetical protein